MESGLTYTPDMLNTCVTLPILWGDMDAYGHVNNVVYLRWFEEARVKMFSNVLPSHILHMIVKTEINYRSAITPPGEVKIYCSINQLGNTSLTLNFKIAILPSNSVEQEDIACDGYGVIVLWDKKQQKKVKTSEIFNYKTTLLETIE